MVASGDSGQVLAMIPGRTKGSLSRFFRDQGAWWCRQVEIVVSDGSRPYQAAIVQYLPDARHVLDTFHVVRWFTQGLTLVRREIQRRRTGAAAPNTRAGPVPKPVSLCYAAPTISQTPTKSISTGCSRLIPVLRTDRDALQELYQLYEAEDLDGANQALGRFADLYATGQIPEYHNTVDTIIAWGAQILAYHTTRGATNGPIEGINNLLQVLRRVAHGFTNTDNFAARALLVTS